MGYETLKKLKSVQLWAKTDSSIKTLFLFVIARKIFGLLGLKMFQSIVLMGNQYFENGFVSIMIAKGIRDPQTENGHFHPVRQSLNKGKSLSLEMRPNQIVKLKQRTGILGNCSNVPDRVEVDIGSTQELVKMNHVRDQKNDKQVMLVIRMNVMLQIKYVRRNAEVVRIQ